MRKVRSLIIFFVVISLLLSCTVSAASVSDAAAFRLQTLGVIDGYDAEHIVTRAEAVSAFVRLLVDEPFGIDTFSFEDVPSDHPYADEVNFAVQIGMIDGSTAGTFNPDEPALGMHIVKMAVNTLGFKKVAEEEGGYEDGYKNVAIKQGLMTGFGLNESVTMEEFVALLDRVLDSHPLEPLYGTEQSVVSTATMYENILTRNDIKRIDDGVVTAVGCSALKGYDELRTDEISIDGHIFKYYGENGFDFLGKNVTAYYEENDSTGRATVIDILPNYQNDEISIKNEDISLLTLTACDYYTNNQKEKTLKIASGASFIYNGINYVPQSNVIGLTTGDVRLVDNDDDGTYDVVFIDEYESFVIDRISSINTAVYFKNSMSFRGKSSFVFDFEDEDKKYTIFDSNNEKISFDHIKMGQVITFQSSMDERLNVVTISDKMVQGNISTIFSSEKILAVDDEVYSVYKPNETEIFSDYAVGNQVTFYLNHKDEIVYGEKTIAGEYGYVIGASAPNVFGGNEQIKIIPSGTSQKEIEETDGTEIIKYNYQNGESIILTFADKVRYTGKLSSGSYVTDSSVSSSSIDMNYLYGTVVFYRLNGEGKVNRLEAIPFSAADLASSLRYNFNGKLNSFGGLSSSPAFLVGSSSNVICIPDPSTNQSPSEDDYYVEVTVTDNNDEKVMPINIDLETQTAECVVLLKDMRSSEPKPFASTTKYSIVGQVLQALDENNDLTYKLEVLTGKTFNTPYAKDSSPLLSVVRGLKCGDIIRYNTKSTGEISNIKKIAGMYEYKDSYSENSDGTVFGLVTDVNLNRLDDFLNDMVDLVTLDLGGVNKTFKILREDDIPVYSYRRSNGIISISETDEIMNGAEVFLLVENNIVSAVVIFK